MWLERYSFFVIVVLTKYGFCRCFNSMNPADIYNTSAVDTLFSEPLFDGIAAIHVEGSPATELWNKSQPFKTVHKDLGFFVALLETSSIEEFRVILHAPHELPTEFSQQFIISDLENLLFRVTPQL